jgi:hypothetical protein
MATDLYVYMHKEVRTRQEINRGGAITGVMAGIIMSLFGMFLKGLELAGLLPMRDHLSHTFFGLSRAFEGGLFIALLGMMSHLLFSAAMGLFFAYLTVRIQALSKLILAGVGFGVGLWAFLTLLLFPMVSPAIAQVSNPSFLQLLTYLIFGLSLALTPYFESKTGKQHEIKTTRR